ncbi:MAG TPA: hypothetical protein VFB41_03085, partial [Solirubrobacteraceae bacterium]|nr:hypothetical protein [Solirubrobacteraceae bacterium]
NAAGIVETRGRTGRKAEPAEKDSGKQSLLRRRDRATQPPSWKAAINRASISALLLFFLMLVLLKQDAKAAFGLSTVALAIYIPIGYLTDSYLYKRRMSQDKR